MSFLDKVQDLGKLVADKAEEAINDGKDAISIAKEEGKIKDATLEIGKVILSLLDAGEGTTNTKISDLYNSIKESRATIEELKNK